MATIYGDDVFCITDLEPTMRVISGRTALAHALLRRLQTPIGGLFYDPDYGFDLRQFVSGQVDDTGRIASGIETELLKDERVVACNATVTFDGPSATLTCLITITDGQGPFSLTLTVDQLTVQLLDQAASPS